VAPAPSVILEKKVAIEAVRAAIEALPVDFRDVIVLREMDGLPESPEVGLLNHIFYILMSRLARARQHLSTLLAEKRQLDQL
jgi:RNA polymerase sigma-70 factor, ECF subfamily